MTVASQQLLAPPTTRLGPPTSSINTNPNLLPIASLVSPIRRPLQAPLRKSSFFSQSTQPLLTLSRPSNAVASAPKFSMRVASKQAYICRDCGYIYNDRTPFEKLPDNYFCPVCGAPKRRFRAFESAVAKNANQIDVRKARKVQIQRDEALGRAIAIAIAVGIVALAGLYFYINSTA
ncbi:Rubredoxin domain [Dillenia turbinata]|uniref:Rubredoxin domain n=1 Tax=Dillenia turbinata TaxID=194707 RepID=A0AAN8Z4J6_9MAGN